MHELSATSRASFAIGVLATVLTAGCTTVKHSPTPEPPPPATQTAPIAAPSPPPVVTPPAAPAASPRPAVPPAVGNTHPTTQAAPAKLPPVVATAKPPPSVAPAASAPAAPTPPPAPLDLTSLETRLRETKAIGVFTKISLKNQVDDLLAQFRAYHKRQTAVSITDLRRTFDMLMLKVLSLLQDSDPALAHDILASRAAIWGILVDPEKFSAAHLMAGDMQ